MGFVIGVLLATVIICVLASYVIDRYPKAAYFNYRFSGFISIFCVAYFFYYLSGFEGNRPGVLPIVVSAFYYLIWLAKVSAICINSERAGFVAGVLKFYFSFFCLIVFPIGILSHIFYEKFEVKKVQDKG